MIIHRSTLLIGHCGVGPLGQNVTVQGFERKSTCYVVWLRIVKNCATWTQTAVIKRTGDRCLMSTPPYYGFGSNLAMETVADGTLLLRYYIQERLRTL